MRRSAVVVDLINAAFTNRQRRRRRYRPNNVAEEDAVALIPTNRRGGLRQFLLTDDIRDSDSDDADFVPGTPEPVSEESQDGETESESDSDWWAHPRNILKYLCYIFMLDLSLKFWCEVYENMSYDFTI